jgi:hypothetical protein
MAQIGQVEIKNVTASGAAQKIKDVTAGDMGLQRSSAVTITGGAIGGVAISNSAIDNTTIGLAVPHSAAFTDVDTILMTCVNQSTSNSVMGGQVRIASAGDEDAGVLNRFVETQTIDMPLAADTLDTINMGFAIPVGRKIIGALFRVDTALGVGKEWNATWDAGHGTLAILAAGAGGVDKNFKAFWWHPADTESAITTGDADIVLTTQGAVDFDGGTITAAVFYEYFTPMADAA